LLGDSVPKIYISIQAPDEKLGRIERGLHSVCIFFARIIFLPCDIPVGIDKYSVLWGMPKDKKSHPSNSPVLCFFLSLGNFASLECAEKSMIRLEPNKEE
jgi:hypothetical protein